VRAVSVPCGRRRVGESGAGTRGHQGKTQETRGGTRGRWLVSGQRFCMSEVKTRSTQNVSHARHSSFYVQSTRRFQAGSPARLERVSKSGALGRSRRNLRIRIQWNISVRHDRDKACIIMRRSTISRTSSDSFKVVLVNALRKCRREASVHRVPFLGPSFRFQMSRSKGHKRENTYNNLVLDIIRANRHDVPQRREEEVLDGKDDTNAFGGGCLSSV